MIYLEDYIDTVGGLPENLQRLVTNIHELKAKVHHHHCSIMKEMDMYTSPSTTEQDRTRLLTSIQARIRACAADDEECALTAMAAHEVTNTHIARANENYIAFCSELHSEELRIEKKRSSAQQIAELHGVNGVVDPRGSGGSSTNDRSGGLHQHPSFVSFTVDFPPLALTDIRLGNNLERSRRDTHSQYIPSPSLKPLPSHVEQGTSSTGATAARALAAVASRTSSPAPAVPVELPPIPPPPVDVEKPGRFAQRRNAATPPAGPELPVALQLTDPPTTRTRGPRAAAVVAAAQVASTEEIADLHHPVSEDEAVPPPAVSAVNEDNEVYCHCRRGNWVGDMIGCDEERCKYEWFHLDCVGMTITPPEGEPWYCPDCRTRRTREEEEAAAAKSASSTTTTTRRSRGSSKV